MWKEKIFKQKSIKNQLICSILITTISSSVLIGVISVILNYYSSINLLYSAMNQFAQISANQVESELNNYKTIAENIGTTSRLSNPDLSNEQKKNILDNFKTKYNFTSCNILDTTGYSIFEGINLSDREYFQQAMNGKVYVSDPTISKTTGEVVVVLAAPLWKDGIVDSQIAGVIAIVPNQDFLNDIVKTIHIGTNGGAYMLDSNGYVIAHEDASKVLNTNLQNTSQQTKENKSQAELEKNMISGETGVANISVDGKNIVMAYTPVSDTNNWSIAVYAQVGDFIAEVIQSIIITVIIVIVFILISIFIAVRLGTSISSAIKICVDRLAKLAQGDLTSDVPTVDRKDELALLTNSTRSIVKDINTIIKDEQMILQELAQGNFQVESHAQNIYSGDFKIVIDSINTLKNHLNDTLVRINHSSDEVANGAEQVSNGAQSLSQGSVEQASSLEELTATVNDISAQVQKNAQNAALASEKTTESKNEIQIGKEQMDNMITAMNNISKSSAEIGKIIKTIEDIAFQTNILALNAAVEAARAGAAGKGFAVVADEVRNLATKSAEASKNTSILVENSIRSVEEGSQIASMTAESLEKIVASADSAATLVNEISEASKVQAQAVLQVTQGLEQISSVVQTNSATAEESAATSEELSGQAQFLKQLVSQFQLNQTADAPFYHDTTAIDFSNTNFDNTNEGFSSSHITSFDDKY